MKFSVTHSLQKASTFFRCLWGKTMLTCLFALLAAAQANAQNITISGRVIGDDGTGIPGASVQVKGAKNGVQSNSEGFFKLTAPANATLLISSVGFVPREMAVNRQTTLNITLKSSVSDLEQVVVIGYGTAKKKDVTGATVSVKGETLREVGAPNIYNQLQGRAAGIDIVNNGSSIGTGGEIRIRGNRSLASSSNSNNAQNGPLLVVDGIPLSGGSINDINPNDIATIDVLKDASATAIYGSRGSGGVIIITTKRGRQGKSVTSYDGYVGVSQAMGTYDLFNAQEYAAFKDAAKQGQPNPNNPHPNALTPIEQENLAKGVNTDWQKLLLTTGIRTDHNISVSGGNETTLYSFGFGVFRETGIVPDQRFDRGSLHIAIDHKMTERLKVGLTTTNTMSWANRVNTNAYGAATRLSPLYLPYNADGSINFQPAIQQSNDAQQISPLTSIGNNEKIKARTRRFRTLTNVYGELEIIKGLKLRSSLALDWIQTMNNNYTGPGTVFNTNTTTAGATLSQSNDETWSYTVDNSLSYEKTFAEKHKIQATALHEVVKNFNQSQQFNGQGVPVDYIQDYNFQLANSLTANASGYSDRGLLSYMGRVFYSYDDRYMLTATVRTDGASVLAPGNQWFTYPALSAGWNMSNENFMRNIKWIDNLKLRVGWGVSSNQTIAPYTTIGSLSSNFYNYGAGTSPNVNFVSGYTVNTLPNPRLTWESTRGYNIGLDFGFFNNRLSGAVEYYNVNTRDILLSKELPRSRGANSVLVNQGKTAGHGVEITLSSLNVKSRSGFTWNTDLNFSMAREKIVALQPGLTQDVGNGWYVGQPLTVIYDVKKIGIWQLGEKENASKYGAAPGDIKIQDVNGNGTIGAEDRQVIGNFQPDFVFGFSNRFAYKNFDLNIVTFGRIGQTVVVTYLTADGGAAGYPFFMNSRVNQYKVNYWTPDNPTNEFPQPDASRDALQYTSTLSYRDGSFIKIRSINLGYNLPSKITSRIGINSMRLYLAAQNPFILWAPLVHDGLGIDPEGNGNGNAVGSTAGGTPVVGRAITVGMGVPPTRQYMFGVNVKF
ncbi:SusC/RagA family TonB-linked outer membrane protein [Chitinophaga filiformis]|uniref:TonB-dependent receptor n=1 Tax=Chitinophaga filiformis TaxID=104663 RepID=A0ABY4I829_CHIFI|nr:TonB-dependent receptor [Chitinophaga filiformis]UPK72246.1 TonB-dependent receptor [Chitinophaga filiformis]